MRVARIPKRKPRLWKKSGCVDVLTWIITLVRVIYRGKQEELSPRVLNSKAEAVLRSEVVVLSVGYLPFIVLLEKRVCGLGWLVKSACIAAAADSALLLSFPVLLQVVVSPTFRLLLCCVYCVAL